MGSRGPAPLPANVHKFRGNPGHKSAANLTDAVNPEIEIPGCPAHLLPEAKKEWRRAAPELKKNGLITKLDRASFALYCQAWARLVWSELELQREMEAAAAGKAASEAKGEKWTGGDGFMLPTPNGSFAYSPYWVAINKASDQVHKFQALFGMSPSARGRVTPSTNQMPLPGMAPEEGFSSL